MKERWRVIDSGHCSAAYNMAVDEAIALSVKKGVSPPTLRLYGWNSLAVTIGCFQRANDVDIKYCAEKYIPIIRRPTGGRAILHGDDITYSFSSRTWKGHFPDLFESYKKISKALILALSKLNIFAELTLDRKKHYHVYQKQRRSPLCLNSVSYGEITINNKKITGSAQKRWSDCLLQQGTIPLVINKEESVKIFRLEHKNVEDSLIGLNDLLYKIDFLEIKDCIIKSFEETFEIELVSSFLSEQELKLAHEIEKQKYLTYEWNFKR